MFAKKKRVKKVTPTASAEKVSREEASTASHSRISSLISGVTTAGNRKLMKVGSHLLTLP
jgi:hypothetical protein